MKSFKCFNCKGVFEKRRIYCYPIYRKCHICEFDFCKDCCPTISYNLLLLVRTDYHPLFRDNNFRDYVCHGCVDAFPDQNGEDLHRH